MQQSQSKEDTHEALVEGTVSARSLSPSLLLALALDDVGWVSTKEEFENVQQLPQMSGNLGNAQ